MTSTAPQYSAIIQMRIDCSLSEWKGEAGHCQWCNKSLAGQSRRKVWCSKVCGQAFEDNHIWNIARHKARKRAKYSCSREDCANPKENLEVNHINPLVGAGYGPSCFHHAPNLEVLCKAHHQIETNRQRSERKESKIRDDELAKHAQATHFIEAHNNLGAQTYGGDIFGGTFLYDSEPTILETPRASAKQSHSEESSMEPEPKKVESELDATATTKESFQVRSEEKQNTPVIPEWMARRTYTPMAPRHPGELLPGAVIVYQPVQPSDILENTRIRRPQYPKRNKIPKRPHNRQSAVTAGTF